MLRIIAITGLLVYSSLGLASSPWVLEPGGSSVTFSFLDETFNEFFRAEQDAILPADIEQNTVTLAFEYGLLDSLSFDIRTGYTETAFAPATRGEFSGRDDSEIGIRWRFLDEFINSGWPTLTLRAVGVVAGNYESSSPGNPHSPGDGASGLGVSLMVGKQFGNGFSLSSELGYENRQSPVPDDVVVNLAAYYSLSSQFLLSAIYNYEGARSGVDIGDPGITPSQFDQLREVKEILGVGLAYNISINNSLGLNVARAIDGRNTGEKDIAVFSYRFSF